MMRQAHIEGETNKTYLQVYEGTLVKDPYQSYSIAQFKAAPFTQNA